MDVFIYKTFELFGMTHPCNNCKLKNQGGYKISTVERYNIVHQYEKQEGIDR